MLEPFKKNCFSKRLTCFWLIPTIKRKVLSPLMWLILNYYCKANLQCRCIRCVYSLFIGNYLCYLSLGIDLRKWSHSYRNTAFCHWETVLFIIFSRKRQYYIETIRQIHIFKHTEAWQLCRHTIKLLRCKI